MNQPGNVYRIGQTEQVTEKLKKRELILEIPGQYAQYVKFEVLNDKCSLFDGLTKGQSINVHFNLNGRLHKDTCYNTLQAWKIE